MPGKPAPHQDDASVPEAINTEQKIFEAARSVFQAKGLEGARMQEIADRAGINKSMLHYYYRSKEKLFEKVYVQSIGRMLPQVMAVLNEELELEPKLRKFITRYLEVIAENPDIPLFIIHEMNKNPQRVKELALNQIEATLQPFLEQIRQAQREGIIIDLPAEHLFTNMMSMMVFPFIGRPVLQFVLGMGETGMDDFLAERKRLLPDHIIGQIMKSP